MIADDLIDGETHTSAGDVDHDRLFQWGRWIRQIEQLTQPDQRHWRSLHLDDVALAGRGEAVCGQLHAFFYGGERYHVAVLGDVDQQSLDDRQRERQ